ncbi:MAG: 2-C-methyl-D-erythritol 2,4-cyclodiphosphate synthase [Candidatus Abyssubacteria bacterium]|nr:2-C-methyl-D-erythritol 2,4-cyclodiphosphate synthase [Candidatus Abyssubacteria bacterium]
MRIGMGFDIHRLVEGDGVILGGMTIPSDKKLLGHSDADALCHAIIDALLGAAALGDIGGHFPDTDPRYKGASSIGLLRQVAEEVVAAGYRIGNVDAVLIAEEPRLAQYRTAIENNISEALGIDPGRVSVKGKTAEGLGPVGAGEAICAHAVALIEEAK